MKTKETVKRSDVVSLCPHQNSELRLILTIDLFTFHMAFNWFFSYFNLNTEFINEKQASTLTYLKFLVHGFFLPHSFLLEMSKNSDEFFYFIELFRKCIK